MGAEIKHVKSWGNGYFRFSVRDIVALITFASMLFGHYLMTKRDVVDLQKNDTQIITSIDSLRVEVRNSPKLVDVQRYLLESDEIHERLFTLAGKPHEYRPLR